jgi:hypothetical protein
MKTATPPTSSTGSNFGGRHGESAALRGLLTEAGVTNPYDGRPLSEALCFGIAGGIGAGYSFCPSVLRYSGGSGVSIVGRHKAYATDAAWYAGGCERLGVKTRLTAATSPRKAFANLQAELATGRPTVVWCSRSALPFQHELLPSCGLGMHSFVVTEIDEQVGIARGYDRPRSPVAISLADLEQARAEICSHKNRTLTIDRPAKLTKSKLQAAVLAGIRACVDELYRQPRMKTFSLPGLLVLAKAIDNDKAKDGWLKAFTPGILYQALRDAFISIETSGTGGGLFRPLYADFLDEAAAITGREELRSYAESYRELAQQWTDTGSFLLPRDVPPFAKTRNLLVKQCQLYETKGIQADPQLSAIGEELRGIQQAMLDSFPLDSLATRELLHGVRCRITSHHASELSLAERLAEVAG